MGLDPWIVILLPLVGALFTAALIYSPFGPWLQIYTLDQWLSYFGFILACMGLIVGAGAAVLSLWNLLLWGYIPVGLIIWWKFRVFAL